MDIRYEGLLSRPYHHYRYFNANGVPGEWSGASGVYLNRGYSRSVQSRRGAFPHTWRLSRPGERGKLVVQGGRRWHRTRVRLAGPKLPPNAFIKTSVAGTCHGGGFAPPSMKNGYQTEGESALFMAGFPPQIVPPQDWEGQLSDLLYTRASDNSFDGYLQLGEALETARMIRAPLTALRRAANALYRDYKRLRKGRKPRGPQKALGDAWLENQFAIQPLVKQTGMLAFQLYDTLNPNSPRYKYELVSSGYRTVELKGVTRAGGTSDSTYIVDEDTHVFRCGGWLQCSTAAPIGLGKAMGLEDVRNIVSQAYELIPLSFALDWIYNVGGLLKACRPTRGQLIHTWATANLKTTRLVYRYKAAGQPGSSSARLQRRHVIRSVGLQPSGALRQGAGLRSVSRAITAAIIGSRIDAAFTRKL